MCELRWFLASLFLASISAFPIFSILAFAQTCGFGPDQWPLGGILKSCRPFAIVVYRSDPMNSTPPRKEGRRGGTNGHHGIQMYECTNTKGWARWLVERRRRKLDTVAQKPRRVVVVVSSLLSHKRGPGDGREFTDSRWAMEPQTVT